MCDDPFHFVFFFAFNQIRRGTREVGAMLFGFMIGIQQGRMKDVVDSPVDREGQLISYRGDFSEDFERS